MWRNTAIPLRAARGLHRPLHTPRAAAPTRTRCHPRASRLVSSSLPHNISTRCWSSERLYPERISVAVVREKKAFIVDLDGVIWHQNKLIPGAKEVIEWFQANDKQFLFLTNSSQMSQRELQQKLARMGLFVSPDHFHTSALATAAFVRSQIPHGSAFVIGEPGLLQALYNAGYVTNNVNPDFVIVGESRHYDFDEICTAVSLVTEKGARLIGTNPDVVDKAEFGHIPACGSLVRPIEAASGRQAFFLGKPSPIIINAALEKLGTSRKDTIMIGDRMDTDILGGVQTGVQTALVLTGVTPNREHAATFAYQPDIVLNSLASILDTSTK